ncbi:nuclear transport factor 2 family protein [Simiduia sp. 21SJ11W-1]|uniref:nuclear transport factor 2 family protein n=1 Tax=Simiduia sp. 21SJ11W-1 TaxID=2909669 RepID=UPI00209D0873|nr:nuclear transport factor 2 family protein [Simiduia sp. 21SJ11W-1]UTA48634.1 nuclear transport factor 2 family protein [Simiduia sp. 21SJ11W-1]
MDDLIKKFKACYSQFSLTSVGMLPAIYAPEAEFIDPVHKVQGLNAIEAYFTDMCQGLNRCEFQFESIVKDGDQVCIRWCMTFEHPRLQGGAPVSVPGVSWLWVANGRVVRHEDHYDMGAMLYEQLPLLGRVIRYLRKRLAVTQKPEAQLA